MPRIGRPTLSEETLRQRIAAYCSRYGARLTVEGLPAFPSGFRETPRHREWMALYKAFSRLRARSRAAKDGAVPDDRRCPLCLQPSIGPARTHRRCAGVVRFVRGLGPGGIERIRAEAFPEDPGPARDVGRGSRRKA